VTYSRENDNELSVSQKGDNFLTIRVL